MILLVMLKHLKLVKITYISDLFIYQTHVSHTSRVRFATRDVMRDVEFLQCIGSKSRDADSRYMVLVTVLEIFVNYYGLCEFLKSDLGFRHMVSWIHILEVAICGKSGQTSQSLYRDFESNNFFFLFPDHRTIRIIATFYSV